MISHKQKKTQAVFSFVYIFCIICFYIKINVLII